MALYTHFALSNFNKNPQAKMFAKGLIDMSHKAHRRPLLFVPFSARLLQLLNAVSIVSAVQATVGDDAGSASPKIGQSGPENLPDGLPLERLPAPWKSQEDSSGEEYDSKRRKADSSMAETHSKDEAPTLGQLRQRLDAARKVLDNEREERGARISQLLDIGRRVQKQVNIVLARGRR